MQIDRNQLAANIFSQAMAGATGLSNESPEAKRHRHTLFKRAAVIAFEMADAFIEVSGDKPKE